MTRSRFAVSAIAFSMFILSGCAGTLGGGLGQFVANTAANVAGPSSTDAVKAVAVVEAGYTVAARLAVVALDNHLLSPTQAAELRELNAAIDSKGADGQRHGLLITARTAAENGDNVVIQTSYQALVLGVKAFTDFEAANGIKAATSGASQ